MTLITGEERKGKGWEKRWEKGWWKGFISLSMSNEKRFQFLPLPDSYIKIHIIIIIIFIVFLLISISLSLSLSQSYIKSYLVCAIYSLVSFSFFTYYRVNIRHFEMTESLNSFELNSDTLKTKTFSKSANKNYKNSIESSNTFIYIYIYVS